MFFKHVALAAQALATLVCASDQGSDRTFDYVVIGGGTAGLVIAARLSEDPDTTVAVIEAGPHHVNEPLVDTPLLYGQVFGNPDFDWSFETVPQDALNGNVIAQARGKMLGGSSGLNGMAWDRASAKEYDAWEKLGAEGWNWNSLLPYFKKTETDSPQTPAQLYPGAHQVSQQRFDLYHGQHGLVHPSFNVLYSNITDPLVEAVNNLGIPTNSDPDEGDATGIYNTENAIDRVKNVGKRSYSASTYYNISADRPNLTVFLTTQATKVNFANHSGYLQAASVDVVAINITGITGTVRARKEVVLSAGTFQTPHLLELSGIGDKCLLERVGIRSVLDLPGVGENLQDHASVPQVFEVSNTTITYDLLRNNPAYFAEQQAEYQANGTGMFASFQFTMIFPPLKSMVSDPVLFALEQQAQELLHVPGLSALTKAQYQIQYRWLSADDVAYTEVFMFPGVPGAAVGFTPGSAYIILVSCNMHPFSRGSVHVNSTDPLVQPVIDPKYEDKNIDLQVLLEGTKFVHKLVETQPLVSLIIGPHGAPFNNATDAERLEFIRKNLESIYHSVGTTAMLPRELGGVVDPKTLKVYGTSNLRVVDASVIPMLIAAHTQATVYAIAERAADIIRGHSIAQTN